MVTFCGLFDATVWTPYSRIQMEAPLESSLNLRALPANRTRGFIQHVSIFFLAVSSHSPRIQCLPQTKCVHNETEYSPADDRGQCV